MPVQPQNESAESALQTATTHTSSSSAQETSRLFSQVIKNEATILALATILAYVFAYRYEAGYLNAFGVPETFVSIDLNDLISHWLWIATFIGGFVLFLVPTEFIQLARENKIRLHWVRFGLFLAVVVILFLRTAFLKKLVVAACLVASVGCLTEVWEYTKRKKTQNSRIEEDIVRCFMLIIGVWCLLQFASTSGSMSASSVKRFAVSGDYVVIHRNGDYAILVDIPSLVGNTETQPRGRILPMTALSSLTFVNRDDLANQTDSIPGRTTTQPISPTAPDHNTSK